MAVNLEMSVELEAPNYQNVEKPTMKTSSSPVTDTQHTGAYRLAGVSVGLMCIIQATLNIVLRLLFSSPGAVEMLPTSCYNNTLSTASEQLQRRYDDLAKEKARLQSNYNLLQIVRNQIQAEKEKLHSKLSTIIEDLRRPGWVSFRASLYYMSTEEMNWNQGRDDCRRRGANLVIIDGEEEQEFIEMLRRERPTWIGLSDQAREGVWTWVDGTPLTTEFWWTDEPNNYKGSEHCVMTGYIPEDERAISNVLSTWNDHTCAAKYSWICEKKFSL